MVFRIKSLSAKERTHQTGARSYWQLFEQALLCFVLLGVPGVARAQSPEVTAEFARATQAMCEGKLEEAGAGFVAVLKLAPAFAEAYFNLGLVRQEQGRY